MQFIVLYNLQESGLSRVSTTFPQITKKNTNWRHNSLAGTDHWNSKLTKYILCEKDNYSVFLIFHNTIFSEYLELNNPKLMLIPLECLFWWWKGHWGPFGEKVLYLIGVKERFWLIFAIMHFSIFPYAFNTMSLRSNLIFFIRQ